MIDQTRCSPLQSGRDAAHSERENGNYFEQLKEEDQEGDGPSTPEVDSLELYALPTISSSVLEEVVKNIARALAAWENRLDQFDNAASDGDPHGCHEGFIAEAKLFMLDAGLFELLNNLEKENAYLREELSQVRNLIADNLRDAPRPDE